MKSKWNTENLKVEALKYTLRSLFKRENSSAYKMAKKLGVLEEICSHMDVVRKRWTDQEILEAAKPFSTRKQFQNGNRKAYELAHRRELLDEACVHMKPTTRTSLMEKELFSIIKSMFPETKTMRDHKVFIEERPYIKRFEIDIFVRRFMKGIEFDGTYHHSYEGLLRGRKHWPIEGVNNYHQIKDEYFESVRNIQILHVKEEEWLKNKEKCVKKCLDFLSC
jgi:hypothetical protein